MKCLFMYRRKTNKPEEKRKKQMICGKWFLKKSLGTSFLNAPRCPKSWAVYTSAWRHESPLELATMSRHGLNQHSTRSASSILRHGDERGTNALRNQMERKKETHRYTKWTL